MLKTLVLYSPPRADMGKFDLPQQIGALESFLPRLAWATWPAVCAGETGASQLLEPVLSSRDVARFSRNNPEDDHVIPEGPELRRGCHL